ncbi:hypothetical protein NZ698_08925 [Chryseobacterium sp. PBS4-4]|uniref:SGNH/GDSL hydrolase family protein n=1 Tax=Chryseobacterium edaphi TaxID=2976532 RepID=A0ABT2W545_9FLAO|nr:hypothetical protein [Chryseobacterium edaphi]MCU7617320.1 hypothetical protein [Chryseobacterium edaphi]
MIKKILNVLYIVLPFLVFSQERISKDESGKVINEAQFHTKWGNENLNLYRWDYMEDKKRICTLKKGQISNPELDYGATLKILEKKLDTVFTENAIIVLDFWYYNDICSISRDDNWPSTELRSVKEFNESKLGKIRELLHKHKQELYVFYIFEKNSKVKKGKKDYFKSFVEDSDNFFRENYFKEQAMCGSNLIITPSGTLLYNGESSIDYLLNNFIN